VQLDTGFSVPELGPGEQRQVQINRAGVQGIDGFGKLNSKVLFQVECTGLLDELLGVVGVDAPVATLVGIDQRGG
jgi:hypothetical protein